MWRKFRHQIKKNIFSLKFAIASEIFWNPFNVDVWWKMKKTDLKFRRENGLKQWADADNEHSPSLQLA